MARAATLSITLCFFERGSNMIAIMLWAFKGEYVSMLGMVPKHQSPSHYVMLHILKFRIKITLNRRLKKGLHCVDFFLQFVNQGKGNKQCIEQ
jgi:hypothetical protein